VASKPTGPAGGPVRVRRQILPAEVKQARAAQRRADVHNNALISARIAAHLTAQEGALDRLRDAHAGIANGTDFDPLQKTRQGAAWLLAGRCISLGYVLPVLLRAGVAVEVAPLARTLHEASSALRIMLDGDEHELHRRWLRDGYFSPKLMEGALKRMEDRMAAEMITQGHTPPGRTDELDRKLYDEWSRIAHNRRSGVLESYHADLRDFAYGAESDPLRRGVWVGYGTQVIAEVTVTVGAGLTKMLGPATWGTLIEPAVAALHTSERDHPLDPIALGFDPQRADHESLESR